MNNDGTQQPGAGALSESQMVAAARRNAAAMRRRCTELGVPPAPTPASIPESIGRYKLERWIATGGMGTVYEAKQTQPDRLVALKVVDGTANTDDLHHQFFKREIMALGRLCHPAIARIYDADRTHAGEQYFTMELVEGRSLTDYWVLKDLSLRQRLSLFTDVCDAVQHAHQHGVIHQDLKPAHIRIDDNGKPHVLDFGLARCIDQEMEIGGALANRVFGTLPYMSPEQTLGYPDGLTLRTDVYSLGVILFELLTGRLPYNVTGPDDETIRKIREVRPARPSSIKSDIDDDVDTIVLKALEKKPDRRYDSAGDLGADVRHYLKREPIDAKRGNRWYVIKMWARRNRWSLAAASVIGVLSVALLALFAHWRYVEFLVKHANRERALYVAMMSAFDPADLPTQEWSRPASPSETAGLRLAIRVLDATLIDDPEFLQGHIAKAWYYGRLGEVPKARSDADRVRPSVSRADDAVAWNGLGRVYLQLGETDIAIDLLDRAARVLDDARAWYDLGRAYALSGKSDEDLGKRAQAAAKFNRALEAYAQATKHDKKHAQAWDGIGRIHLHRERFEEAKLAFQAAADADPSYWPAAYYLALCQHGLGNEHAALEAYEKFFRLVEPRQAHVPELAKALNYAAWIQLTNHARQDYSTALKRATDAVTLHEKLNPGAPEALAESPKARVGYPETLALAELRNGKNEDALKHANGALSEYAQQAAPNPEDSAWSLAIRAYVWLKLDNVEAAKEDRDSAERFGSSGISGMRLIGFKPEGPLSRSDVCRPTWPFVARVPTAVRASLRRTLGPRLKGFLAA